MSSTRINQQDGWLAPAYFFAQLQIFSSTFANSKKRDHCFECSFQKIFYINHFHNWFLYFVQNRGITLFGRHSDGTAKLLEGNFNSWKQAAPCSRYSAIPLFLINIFFDFFYEFDTVWIYLPFFNCLRFIGFPLQCFLANFSCFCVSRF